ncbi:hypothetical protein J2X11_000981 [Aeromicrobium panaciterrae]|uniref:Ricin B lectin domain-containing protein n=1 Tax=Aeromicrobium panaciterrae TaxID=363861 RepID=A0ABU1ULT3_9ACTN|nr:RICIN domain-containing protein [Aeromicrobium panaciterrae]MDR7086142.1 hypothetical protein [Aeromicrobium panaciterrae]
MNHARSARKRFAAALATLVAATSLVAIGAVVAAPAQAATSTTVVKTVTYNGKTLTLRMKPVKVRSSSYRVDVQQADGTLKPYAAAASKAYIGSVDGDAAAIAEGIINSSGDFVGQVVFDRGSTIYVKNNAVTGNRGLTQPTTYKWPSSGNASRNATTTSGQFGSGSYEWNIGYDVANAVFADAPISGSVAKAVEQMDLNAVAMLGAYATNIGVRPMIGRVIIRANAAQDPYLNKGPGESLPKIQPEWDGKGYTYAGMDSAMVLSQGGGGVAQLGNVGGPAWGASGGPAWGSIVVQRHEFGHNWGADDNHTNGPEGATINSGNQYDRWDGTEVRSMLNTRNGRLAKFPSLGTFSIPLPPYASLDLVDSQMSKVKFTFNPIANDHDVNGGSLALLSVKPTSKLGGTLTKSGNAVTYTPPTVSTKQTVDWAQYVVKDSTGKKATGVMLFRVDPYVAPPASSTWKRHDPAAATGYQLTNKQSGLVAAVPVGSTGRQYLRQRKGIDTRSVWVFKPSGSNLKIVNKSSKLCVGIDKTSTASGARAVQSTCSGKAHQQWKVVDHPNGDRALINVASKRCLSVKGSSISSNAYLIQTTCGLSSAQIWKIGFLPMSSWAAYTPPTTGKYELVNASSNLHVGTAPGASWSAPFVQRAAGTETAVNFLANADGSYRVRQVSSNKCFNDEAGSHARVVLWDCNEGTGGAKVRFRKHPAGGIVMLGVIANECIGIKDNSNAVDALLDFAPCTSNDIQRWKVVATP